MRAIRLLLWVALGASMGCSILVDPNGTRDGESDGGVSDGGADADTPDGDRPDRDLPDTDLPDVDLPDVPPPPMCPDTCDDGVECTEDSCSEETGFFCVNTPVDSICGDGQRCMAGVGCVDAGCERDEQCDDGNPCNGVETCSEDGACAPGEPVVCEDEFDCTIDACDPETGRCAHQPNHDACDDGVECTQELCDPEAGCRNVPRNGRCEAGVCEVGVCDPAEGCGTQPRDCAIDDPCFVGMCDPDRDECVRIPVDADGDGEGPMALGCGGDCNDMNASINSDATEVCDGIDNDCNGDIDDGIVCETPDFCGEEAVLSVDVGGSVTVRGSFDDVGDNYNTGCSTTSGPDAVYAIDVPRTLVDITIELEGTTADTVLGVRGTCGDWTTSPSVGSICNDDRRRGEDQDSRLWLHNVAASGGFPSRLYILVDSWARNGEGDFQLTVSIDPAARDVCSASPLDIRGGGTVFGTILGENNQRPSCATTNRPEAVFQTGRFGEAEGLVVTSRHILYARSSCSGDDLDCDNSSAGSQTSLEDLDSSFMFLEASTRSQYLLRYNP